MLELLKQIDPPPKVLNNKIGSWKLVENNLGFRFPKDYKFLIECYGDYYWKDFLWILNPFSDSEHLNLIKKSKVILITEKETQNKFPQYYPINVFSKTTGIFPWAITDNGDVLFWVVSDLPENKWATMIKGPRSPEFEVVFQNTTSIVYNFMRGTLNSTIIPQG